jgi:hypothetical protein
MTDEATSLKSAIEKRTSDDFDTRCAALTEIISLAHEAEDVEVRTGAVNYLHQHLNVAVIEDPKQPAVLATIDGVHIERRVG